MSIDINCDLGEGYGRYRAGDDALFMKYISSANIACGFHAGDYITIGECVRLCIDNSVSIGAHPGYPDIQGFGRRSIEFTPVEVYYMILYQVGALKSIVEAEGGILRHIKPHGAMYNSAVSDREMAMAIVEAVRQSGDGVILLCMAGSEMEKVALEKGVPFAREAFPDRLYTPDGLLEKRTNKNAIITQPEAVASRAIEMITEKRVSIDSFCIHGDSPNAEETVMSVRSALEKIGIPIKPFKGRRSL